MPAKKLYTDEQLREHRNSNARAHYQKTKGARAAYHAAWHRKNMQDPSYVQRMRDKARAWAVANPEKSKAQSVKRRKEKLKQTKEYQREWFAKNRDKAVVYQQNRRKRAVAAGGKLSIDIRRKLMVLQRGKCACCHADLKKIKINLDHIMPLALGGAHSDENAQLLCQPCNNQKYAKHPVDFMQEKGFLL